MQGKFKLVFQTLTVIVLILVMKIIKPTSPYKSHAWCSIDIKLDRLSVRHGNLENKGIVFKARWFVRPDINTGATII